MPSRSSLVLRVCVRLSLGLLLLAGLCLALGVQVRFAHAQTTLTVTDCSSDTMLQTDVSQANMDNDGDTITFQCGASATIPLTAALNITGSMTIDGGQAITLDGQGASRIFQVSLPSSGVLTLTGLILTNGAAMSTCQSFCSPVVGGALDNTGSGTVNITNSTFSTNDVAISTCQNICPAEGGALANTGSGTVTITNSTFSTNTVTGPAGPPFLPRGGAILNNATMTITNSTFNNNSLARGEGGALVNRGTLSITNSTFASNAAGDGGAIISNGFVTITNSTIANNSAPAGGGGIENLATMSSLGSIVAENTGGDCINQGSFTDQGDNMDSDNSCFTAATSLHGNPQLGPLATNGGPTQTMALQQGSPAIDAGPPTGQCLTTDQRGDARPDNDEATCDIGAYEFQDPLDNDLALINMPANITTNATSPSGAVVTYTAPTVVDEDSPLPSVNCSPASGSPFAITTTTVTCTVTDSDDSNSPVSKSFTVTVKGAAAQVGDQISVVQGLPIASGLKSSLVTQLQTVQADLSANNTAQACIDLKSYINHVKAQSGKGLTVSQANQLLAAATNIQHVLAC